VRPTLRSAAVGVLVLAALAGCAGPPEPLEVGTQPVPLDLVLGEHKALAAAPGPVIVAHAPVTAPIGIRLPVAVPSDAAPSSTGATRVPSVSATILPSKRLPSASAVACPDLDPLAPVAGTGTYVSKAPAAGSYTYRGVISQRVGDASATFAGPTTWTVGAPTAPDAIGGFSYDVAVAAAGTTTTTTFYVVPFDPANPPPTVSLPADQKPPSPPPGPPTPGIYISKIASKGAGSAATTTFSPTPVLPVAHLPLSAGESITATSTDGTSTWAYTASVTGKAKLNACGNPVLAWNVSMPDLAIRTADPTTGTLHDLKGSWTIQLGTQFGGLVVGAMQELTGTQVPTVPVSRRESFTINSVPPVVATS
jgi:hypothetical protein